MNNPYFEASSTGAEGVATALEGEYEYTGPSDASASSQVSYIDTLSQQATDVILLSANDPNALCSSLDQARAGGSVVVTFDSDVDPACRDLFVSQVNSDEVGLALLEMTAEQIDATGKIAILSATANATNQNAWIEVMQAELESNPSYADMELVEVVYGDDEDEKSFSETQGLLQAHPDLGAIISPTTVGIAAAARYLSGIRVPRPGGAHRPGHPEPDAGVREGRHGHRVRALGPHGPRRTRRLHRRGRRLGHHHRC